MPSPIYPRVWKTPGHADEKRVVVCKKQGGVLYLKNTTSSTHTVENEGHAIKAMGKGLLQEITADSDPELYTWATITAIPE